jgi:Domain of unknown function (DUF4893)
VDGGVSVARAALTLAMLATAACSNATPRPAQTAAPTNWKGIVLPADLSRLRGWRDAFVKGLAEARADGNGDAIAREGALLVPDAAIAPVAFPPGLFRCRVIKLGAGSAGMLAYVSYPAFACRVSQDGGVMRFVKTGGSQRPIGRIFDDSPERKIFLGTLMLGDETRPFNYGDDADRDMAGAVQRIGERRWRLILPSPRFESIIDVIELVPAE